MGAGEGGYVRITLQTRQSRPEADLLHRVSELRFSSAPVPDDPDHAPISALGAVPAGPPPATPPAGKLGLGGVKSGDVKAFRLFARLDDDTFMDMGLAGDKGVTHELRGAFGGDWAGFAVALAPAGGRFRLVADITLKPCWKKKAKKPFQVIPIVMAFGTDQFVDHYLLAVIVAQETVDKVDTSVTQPYR